MSNSTSLTAARSIAVPFHGANLCVVEHNGQPYTPMKPIVDGIGLDWKSQHRKVAGNEARWGMAIITMPMQGYSQDESTSEDLHGQLNHAGLSHQVGDAGQRRALTCIPVRKVAAWLATVEPGKVKNPEVRARVIQYQNECDDVLWQYWNDGIAVNPRAAYSVNPGDVLTKDEADSLRQTVEGMAKKLSSDTKVQGQFIMKAWSKLKSHFRVGYRQIPRAELTEALSIVNRHTVEWELVDETPADADRVKLAFALASQASMEVERTVFNAVMAEDPELWQHNRYLLALTYDRNSNKPTVPWSKAIGRDQMVTSMKELARRLDEGDGPIVSDQDLANLAAACNKKLAQRMTYEAARLAA